MKGSIDSQLKKYKFFFCVETIILFCTSKLPLGFSILNIFFIFICISFKKTEFLFDYISYEQQNIGLNKNKIFDLVNFMEEEKKIEAPSRIKRPITPSSEDEREFQIKKRLRVADLERLHLASQLASELERVERDSQRVLDLELARSEIPPQCDATITTGPAAVGAGIGRPLTLVGIGLQPFVPDFLGQLPPALPSPVEVLTQHQSTPN